eukprot:Nk52_evm59s212 gene=Nk52_evmTU59s212
MAHPDPLKDNSEAQNRNKKTAALVLNTSTKVEEGQKWSREEEHRDNRVKAEEDGASILGHKGSHIDRSGGYMKMQKGGEESEGGRPTSGDDNSGSGSSSDNNGERKGSSVSKGAEGAATAGPIANDATNKNAVGKQQSVKEGGGGEGIDHSDLKTHFTSREGKYILKTNGCYMHPSGKLMHSAQPIPVCVSFVHIQPYFSSRSSRSPSPRTSLRNILEKHGGTAEGEAGGGVGGNGNSGGEEEEKAAVPKTIRIDATKNLNYPPVNVQGGGNLSPRGNVGSLGAGSGGKKQGKEKKTWKTVFKKSPNSSSKKTGAVGQLISSSQNKGYGGNRGSLNSNSSALTNGNVSSASSQRSSTATLNQVSTIENTCLCFNVGRAILFHEYLGCDKPGDFTKPYLHATVRSSLTCHDFNALTRSPEQLELIAGMHTGELVYCDPINCIVKYFNNEGIINDTKVTCVKWVPGTENLFLVAHLDGTMYVYDKDMEDPANAVELGPPSGGKEGKRTSPLTSSKSMALGLTSQGRNQDRDDRAAALKGNDTGSLKSIPTIPNRGRRMLSRELSISSTDAIKIVKPSVKNSRSNPVSKWTICPGAINAMSFSPDCKHLAVVGRDGLLKVFDFEKEKLIISFESYFGALLCVCWSPDGRYLLAGGEDDLVTMWSFEEHKVVARGEGHSSWVSAVAFDSWNCNRMNYRFGSVGQDGKFLLWDFSVTNLHRPRGRSNFQRPQHPIEEGHALYVTASKRAEVPLMDPIVSQVVHHEPLTSLVFREDAVFTACQTGQIKVWIRPEKLHLLSDDIFQSESDSDGELDETPTFISANSASLSRLLEMAKRNPDLKMNGAELLNSEDGVLSDCKTPQFGSSGTLDSVKESQEEEEENTHN